MAASPPGNTGCTEPLAYELWRLYPTRGAGGRALWPGSAPGSRGAALDPAKHDVAEDVRGIAVRPASQCAPS